MDNNILHEDQDGWSRPATPTPHCVAVLPNEDIRTLFRKWQKEARTDPAPDIWKWWSESKFCEDVPQEWYNPTNYGFKGWELE